MWVRIDDEINAVHSSSTVAKLTHNLAVFTLYIYLSSYFFKSSVRIRLSSLWNIQFIMNTVAFLIILYFVHSSISHWRTNNSGLAVKGRQFFVFFTELWIRIWLCMYTCLFNAWMWAAPNWIFLPTGALRVWFGGRTKYICICTRKIIIIMRAILAFDKSIDNLTE